MAGKSGEFSKTRNVNKMSGGSRGSDGDPRQRLGSSTVKQPPFNGSNVYGISGRGGAKGSSGGSAPGASKGNSTFGSGSARPSTGAAYPKGRTGRRGGR